MPDCLLRLGRCLRQTQQEDVASAFEGFEGACRLLSDS